jgi:early secretory antigenic target protein ESAT-6
MADGAVLVTFATIQEAAERTGSTNRSIQTLLDDLYSRLQPIIATWTGTSAEGFQYQHQQWVAAAQDLNTVLENIATVLLESHDTYSQAESDVQQLWNP